MTVQRRQRSRRHRFAWPRLLGGFGNVLDAGEIFLGLERRHAAHAGGGDRLAVDVVGDVAGGIDAGMSVAVGPAR